jgi:hypothetical protein
MEDWEDDATETVSGDCTSWCTAHFWIVPAKVEGTWQTPQGDLKLTQEFQKVKGTLGTQAVEGRLAGDQLTLTAGGKQIFTGKVEGTTIKGSAWSATRK